MVDIQTISIVIASASVVAGVIYNALQLRHQNRMRQTDLVMRLYLLWDSKEFRDMLMEVHNLQFKDYEDFVKKYGRRHSGKSPEIEKAISNVCGFFELVGVLLLRKHIDLGLVYDSFGVSMIKEVWEKFKPVTVGIRREVNDRAHGAGFEYLYNELMRKEPQLRKTLPKASLLTGFDSNLSNQPSGAKNG